MIILTQQEAVDLIEVLNLARLELQEVQHDGAILTSGAIEGLEQVQELIEDKMYNKEESNDEENFIYKIGE